MPGVLDDHVALGEACLALHEATGEARWLAAASDLGAEILRRFWDGEVLSLSPLDAATLPVRRAQWIDSAEPAASCLLYTSPSPRDRYGSRMPSSA